MNEDKRELLSAFCLKQLAGDSTSRVTFIALELSDLLEHYAKKHPEFSVSWTDEEIEESLDALEEKGLIEAFKYPYTANRYDITDDGLLIASNPSRDIAPLFAINKYGYFWLFEALSNMELHHSQSQSESALFTNSEMTSVPASDRIVRLDHNSAEFTETTTKLDELIEAVDQDRTNDFDQKDQCLAELKAGRELLKSPIISPEKVKILLYGCLAFLAAKFADEPIGALAHLTWTSIKTLLGI